MSAVMTSGKPSEPGPPCRHDSTRIDGTLDAYCLRCGAHGWWHDGHAHFLIHPSGKVLFDLACPEPLPAAPATPMPDPPAQPVRGVPFEGDILPGPETKEAQS